MISMAGVGDGGTGVGGAGVGGVVTLASSPHAVKRASTRQTPARRVLSMSMRALVTEHLRYEAKLLREGT
jgi:hypothetical protein